MARLAGDGVRKEQVDVGPSSDVAMPDLVELMAAVVGKPPLYDYVNCGQSYRVDFERIRGIVERCGIVFDDGYLERVLIKYYGIGTRPGKR